jgi:hypothetical protein
MRYAFTSSILVIMIGTTGLLAFASGASAQQAKTKEVVRQFKIVNDSVVEVPYQKVPNPAYDTVRVRTRWTKLKRGMTEMQVTRLLGRPQIYQCDPFNAINYWWYGKHAVVFNAITKKVSGWDK